MNKKVAIVQSNYIPWKGYFDLIAAVDEFIIFDDVQFTRRDWRNRNQIKTPNGNQWLTVPVQVKGMFFQKISETKIANPLWFQDHWRALQQNYGRAKFFNETADWLKPIFFNQNYTYLSELNLAIIKSICTFLNVTTLILNSSSFELENGKNERLLSICLQADANIYVSGPAAGTYLDTEMFKKVGIEVNWFNYECYLEYPQLWGAFNHHVSILDLLFNCGPNARHYMKLGKA